MNIQLKPTIGPDVTWNDLRRHSVVRSLGLEGTSGAGLPLALAALQTSLQSIRSTFSNEWLTEIVALAEQSASLALASTPTIWDRRDARVPKIHDFLTVTRHLIDPKARAILRLFGTHVFECALSDRAVHQDFIHGLIQVAKPSSSRDIDPDQVTAWHGLWPKLITGEPFHLEGMDKLSVLVRKFCLHVNRIFEFDVSTPAVTMTLEKIRSSTFRQAEPIHEALLSAETSTALSDKVLAPRKIERPKKDSRPPSPKLGWHEYLSAKSKFSTTSERLGLDHWDALPLPHVQHICGQLTKDLFLTNLYSSVDAVVLVMSLIAGADLTRTLDLQITRTPNDIGIDLTDGTLTYRRRLLFPLDSTEQNSLGGILKIPLPLEVVSKLREWNNWTPSASLGALLSKIRPGNSLQVIEESAHQRLKQLGDPNFLAWPGKWARSANKIYVSVIGSDLLAAVCTLSPQVSAPGALSYFHPPQNTIAQACNEAYQQLGFTDINTEFGIEQHRDGDPYAFPSDSDLKDGFTKLIADFKSGCLACGEFSNAAVLFESLNRVTRLGAALLVFVYGGRGSRTDQLKFGSVLGSDAFFHLHDKDLDDERGSRLLPKLQLVRDILDWYLLALRSAASTALNWVHHNGRKTWRELSNLQLRFEAVAFQTVQEVCGAWIRKPIESADIEQVARQYFGARKNFMRHVLVTQWACQRLDRNLLRVITGHSHDRLDVPSALSVHPPASVIEAAGQVLNQWICQWIDPQSLAPLRRPSFQLLNISLGRIYKVHTAYSAKLEEAGSACGFGRWHLAAIYVVNKLRQSLLSGVTSLSPRAELLLHLALFDLLHDEDDLKTILSSMNITRSKRGFIVQWRRLNEVVDCVLPLQLPTSLMLLKMEVFPPLGDPSPEIAELETWLRTFWNADPQLSDTTPSGRMFSVLLSALRLWGDLHLPGVTQFAYLPSNHSVQAEVSSALKLLGKDQSQAALPPESHRRTRASLAGNAREIQEVLDALNHAADRTRPLGGDKARTRAYIEAVASKRIQGGDTWAYLLNRCFRFAMDALISGKADAIQFSSMATYVSALRPQLLDPPEQAPSEMSDIDFVELSRQFREFEHVPGDRELSGLRAQQQQNAAFWLLRCMRHVGLPIPGSVFADRLRELCPSKSGRVVHVTDDDVKAASATLIRTNFAQPNQRLQAELAMVLLQSLPLRAQELTTLRFKDFAVLDKRLLLRESKFDHLKSTSGWRSLALSQAAVELFDEHKSRLKSRSGLSRDSDYVFLNRPDKEVHLANAVWLHDGITEAFWSVTGNWNFRVHTLRARVACNIAFPNWEDVLQSWSTAKSGPRALTSYFTYNHDSAWRAEHTRAAMGHSQVSTSTLYYLYNCGFVRAMATAATLAEFEPNAYLCNKVGVSTHALRKSMQRHPNLKIEPWCFLMEKLRIKNSPSEPASAPTTSVKPSGSAPKIDHKSMGKFFGLRLLEVGASVAADESSIPLKDESHLETMFLQSAKIQGAELRARQKGSAFGRPLEADLRLYRSEGFELFYKAWCDLSFEQMENLKSFLEGKGDATNWLFRLGALIDNYIDSKGLSVEVVLGSRYTDSATMAQLQILPGIRSIHSVRDQGKHPRVFVFPTDLKPSLVLKSRYLSVSRVVLESLFIMHKNSTASQQTPIFWK